MKKLLLIGALLSVLCSCGSSNNGAKKALTGTHEDHEWVDLGLPSGLKWATCNVDAKAPEASGNYYAWGETTIKEIYLPETCTSSGQSWENIGSDPSRDVATAKWGGNWRMPTTAEFQELIDNCEWTWSEENDNSGYKVTGPNGNSIFLPAAGYRYNSNRYAIDYQGYYWSSLPDNNSYMASNLIFDDDAKYMEFRTRHWGYSVRPVLED